MFQKPIKVASLEWVPTEKITISDSKVVKERMGTTGDILRDVAEKQQDGSWKKTFQGIDLGLDDNYINKNYSRHFVYTYDEAGNVVDKKRVYRRKPSINSNEKLTLPGNLSSKLPFTLVYGILSSIPSINFVLKDVSLSICSSILVLASSAAFP